MGHGRPSPGILEVLTYIPSKGYNTERWCSTEKTPTLQSKTPPQYSEARAQISYRYQESICYRLWLLWWYLVSFGLE
jgi:hypothetical protein